MPSKMLLVDGNSLMHRAFHALPVMSSDNGEYTNALHGFTMMLFKAVEEEQPDLIAVAFDRHGPTFRHLKYEDYKAGRAPTPEELRPQFISVRELLGEMNVTLLELDGYEADDLLGTMSRLCEEEGIDDVIITGDRDAFQLAGEHTTVLYTKQGIKDTERVTPQFIREKYGVTPAQMIDVKGLMGDNSDNIPGIQGIGEKTALKLIAQYGSLEAALDDAPTGQKGKLRERLMEGRESALFSKWLATIDRRAPIALAPRDCPVKRMQDGLPMLKRLQLRQAAARLASLKMDNAPEPVERTEAQSGGERLTVDREAFAREMERFPQGGPLALAMADCLSAALPDGRVISLRMGGDLITPGVSDGEAIDLVAGAAARAGALVLHDMKAWARMGLALPENTFDVMLAGYLINPQRHGFSLGALAAAEGVGEEEGFEAAALGPLSDLQRERLRRDGMEKLLFELEQPLARVLSGMERAGFMTDEEALRALDERFSGRINELLSAIRETAGPDFNANSPKQLGHLLFETLGLKGGKKTKTGWSTSADILEQMENEHPLIPLILEYRKYTKLKSTYIDALLRMRDGEGRIHTSFDQVSTATGRISSLEPNLQNIPVRTPLGREIRRAFVARPGWALVDADYSQIELRVLAHMSGDEVMRDAFIRGQDIHARTASEVYGVPLEDVTGEMRSAAKAVNFGIVYGISDFGLARNIGVSRAEAARFIERYLGRYPKIKRFMDECVTQGHTDGYVSTLMGRRRYLPEMEDRNYSVRQFGERTAMNSPIQGTAADIIKLAMVKVDRALKEAGMEARLILQVHDELIVEAPQREAQQAASLLKRIMEDVMELSVPLTAEVNLGKSWYECK